MSTLHPRALSLAVPASAASPRDTAHLSKRARALKLQLSSRLRAVRAQHGLDRDEVYDRPSFVTQWESPHKPHAPNLLHLVAVGSDQRSRVYALEALQWATEELEREQSRNPAQLSLLDLIAANPDR